MASLNRVMIIGNLGKDPEVRYMSNGEAVANLTVATTETWKDKAGEKQEKTEWHRVTLYRKQAEVAGEYLKKGGSVYIEGKLQTREWTDNAGVKKYTTEIIGNEMKMLGSKPSGGSDKSYGSQEQPARHDTGTSLDQIPDDIPF